MLKKKGDYDGIMLHALTIALCPKSCRHNTSQVIFVFLLFLGTVMFANEVETKGK